MEDKDDPWPTCDQCFLLCMLNCASLHLQKHCDEKPLLRLCMVSGSFNFLLQYFWHCQVQRENNFHRPLFLDLQRRIWESKTFTALAVWFGAGPEISKKSLLAAFQLWACTWRILQNKHGACLWAVKPHEWNALYWHKDFWNWRLKDPAVLCRHVVTGYMAWTVQAANYYTLFHMFHKVSQLFWVVP